MFFDVGAHRWSRLLLAKLAIHIQIETIEMNIKYSLSYFKSECLLCMSWLEVYLKSGSLLKAFIFIFRNY
jgi:hypothetical protein